MKTTSATSKKATKTATNKAPTQVQDIESELDLDPTSYSGTFRWKATKTLPQLPAFPPLGSFLNLQEGWKGYFESRGGDALVLHALNDLCLVDCLSFVLTIPYFVHIRNVFNWHAEGEGEDGITEERRTTGIETDQKGQEYSNFYQEHMQYDSLTLLCMGCSKKAEERVLLESNVFAELLLCFPNIRHIHMYFIGPEISHTEDNVVCYGNHDNSNAHCLQDDSQGHLPMLHAHLFQGTMLEFFRSKPQYLNQTQHPAMIVGYNCGFGNFENPLPRRYDLFASWYADLLFLTGTQLPILFTCANDYADLFGEVNILCNIFGATLIDAPTSNPFGFASTMIPPSTTEKEEHTFARGNSFSHAIQGHVKERRLRIPNPQVIGKEAWLEKILPIVAIKNLHSKIITNMAYYMKPSIGTLALQPYQPESEVNPLLTLKPEIAPKRVSIPTTGTVISSNESVTSLGNDSMDATIPTASLASLTHIPTANNKKKRRKKKVNRISDRYSETSEDTYATSTVRSDSPLTTTTENTEYAHSMLGETIEEAIALESLNLRDDHESQTSTSTRLIPIEMDEEEEEDVDDVVQALPSFDGVYDIKTENQSSAFVLQISHQSNALNSMSSDLKQLDIQLHTSGKQLLLSNYVTEMGKIVSIRVDKCIELPDFDRKISMHAVQAKYSKKKDMLTITLQK